MTITVEGPGGVEVEFPDGTPPEVMQAALRKHFGGPETAAPNVTSLAPATPFARRFQDNLDEAIGGLQGPGQGVLAPEMQYRRPRSLAERFAANYREGKMTGTIAGAGELQPEPPSVALLKAGTGEDFASYVEQAQAEGRDLRAREQARMADYADMTDAATLPEYGAAIGGQIFGNIVTPENVVGLPMKGVQALYRGARNFAGPIASRIFTRGTQVAVPSVLTDPLVQGLRIGEGVQDEYDPLRTALSGVLGFGIGGTASAGAQGWRAVVDSIARARGVPANTFTPESVTLDDVSPEVLQILEANGILDPQAAPRLVAEAQARLSARQAARDERAAAVVAQTQGTPPEGARVDLDSGADVQAVLQPAPPVVSVPPGAGQIADAATPQQAGNVAGQQLRGQFNAPAVVEPQPTRMSAAEIAAAAARGRATEGPTAQPPGERMAGSEGRLPQTEADVTGQQQAGEAFDLAARQRARAGAGVVDTQAAGQPQGPQPVRVVLDEGFPVEVMSTRFVPDERGGMVQVAKVRRTDPRTGQPEADAFEYEVPTRQLKQAQYDPEPVRSQDFRDRAGATPPPERPRMAQEGVSREAQQTYRTTAPDPNTEFPGAGTRGEMPGGPGGLGGRAGPAEHRGRTPFPEQPEGPFPGRQRPRNEDEAIADFERRQKERAADEEMAREQKAREQYSGGQQKGAGFSTRAADPDKDGRFGVDDYGYVRSDKGGPVKFADQKQAAKWILNVGHKKSPDQFFEIHNHPSGKGFTVRERGRGEASGAGDGPRGSGPTGGAARNSQNGDPNATKPPPQDTTFETPPFERSRENPNAPALIEKDLIDDGQNRAEIRKDPGVEGTGRAQDAGSGGGVRPDRQDQRPGAEKPGGGDSAGGGGAAGRADPQEQVGKDGRTAAQKRAAADELDALRIAPDNAARLRREADELDPPPAKAEPDNFVSEDGDATGYLDPDAKPGRGNGAPRTTAQAEARLNKADRERNQPPLNKFQKIDAEAAKAETGAQFREAADKARGSQAEHEAWRASEKSARQADAKTANPTMAGYRENGWKAAMEDRDVPYRDGTDARKAAQDGYDAAQAWVKENPRPVDRIDVTATTARGKETTYSLEPDAEKILEVAERINKLPLDRFYTGGVFDPQLWKQLFGPMLGKEAGRWADEVGDLVKDLKGSPGKDTAQGFTDFGKTLVLSNDGILRSIAHQFPEAREAIEGLADQFFAPVGRQDKTGVAPTYQESVERRVQSSLNKLAKLLKPFDDYRLEQQRQVLEQISRLIVSGKVRPGTSQVHAIAGEIQGMLKDWLKYARDAGVEIGDQGSTYFPVEYSYDKILSKPDAFLKDAERAYRTDGMTGEEAKAQAQAWFRRIQESDLGFRSDGNDFHQVVPGKTSKNERARELSDKARTHLEPYIMRGVQDVLPQYMLRMARRAEWVRRMGPNLEKWNEIKADITAKNAGAAIPEIVRTLQSITGAVPAPTGSAARAALSAMRVAGITTYLPRATLSSLSEPVLAGVRTGNAGDSLNAAYGTLKDIVRQVAGIKDTSSRIGMARELAEDLGLVSQIGDDMLMAQRFGGQIDNKIARKITNQFFTRIGLHHFTEATRVASASIGQIFMRRLSRSVAGDDLFTKSSQFLLGELGVTDPQAMAKFVNGFKNGMPSPEELRTSTDPMAAEYMNAIYRFASQVVLKPGGAEKARYANHPIGGLFYHLQGYNYGFQKNVLNRFGRLGAGAFRAPGMNVADRLRLLAPMAWFGSMAIPLQYAIGELRDQWQKDPGKDPKYGEMEEWQKWTRATSRAGLGLFDLPVNLATQSKYARDPATTLVGPIFGGMSELAKSLLELNTDENSPNTNTAERRAARYVYETIAKPMMISMLSLLPGKIGTALSVPGIQYVAKPSTRDKAVTATIGEPDWKTRNAGSSSRGSDRGGSGRSSSRSSASGR